MAAGSRRKRNAQPGAQPVVGGGEVDRGDPRGRVHVDIVAGDAAHSAGADQLAAVVRGGGGDGRFVEVAGGGVDGFQRRRQPLGRGGGDAGHPDLHEVAPDVEAVAGEDRTQRAGLQLAAGAVEWRRQPSLVAQVLVADDPEMGGADGVRPADLDAARPGAGGRRSS